MIDGSERTDPIRVLVYIGAANYGGETMFYLARRLAGSEQFVPVVVTGDRELMSHCEAAGVEFHFDDRLQRKRSLLSRAIRKIGVANVPLELAAIRRFERISDDVLRNVEPDVQLLPVDMAFSPLLYLARSSVPTVIPQITLDMTSVDQPVEFMEIKERSHYEAVFDRVMKPIVRYFDRDALPTIAGESILPWNDPAKHLVLRLRGIDFPVYQKGGLSDAILAVNGPEYESLYETSGLPSSRLSVTGSPTHDILFERRSAFEDEKSREFLDNHGIPTDKPVAVFFGQALDRDYLPGEYHKTARKVVGSLIERGYQVVVKTHPKQSASEYDYLPQGSTTLIDTATLPFMDNTKTNIDLVLSSDLVVTQGSTVGYIAMATETPLLTYNFNGIPTADCYAVTGGSLHAWTEEAFDSNLDSLQEDDRARGDLRREQRAVVEAYTMLDGNVTDRFLTLLSELADDE